MPHKQAWTPSTVASESGFRATGFGAAPHNGCGHGPRRHLPVRRPGADVQTNAMLARSKERTPARQKRLRIVRFHAEARKLTRSALFPFPAKTASLGFGGMGRGGFPRKSRATRLQSSSVGHAPEGVACEATRRQRIAHTARRGQGDTQVVSPERTCASQRTRRDVKQRRDFSLCDTATGRLP